MVVPFLLADEAVECLLASIVPALGVTWGGSRPGYAAVVRRDGVVVAAAVRTPVKLLLSRSTHTSAPLRLAQDVASHLPELTAALGPEPEMSLFVQAWARLNDRQPCLLQRQRIYRLDRVCFPQASVAGAARPARPSDAPLLLGWAEHFSQESGLASPPEPRRDLLEQHVRRGTLFVWEDGGEPVSMAAIGGETPNTARINLVYTPPWLRRRGYASACTAALSQHVLNQGKRCCVLYTDLASPTTNHIYQTIGYRPVRDASDYLFPRTTAA